MREQYCECLVSRRPDGRMRLLTIAAIVLAVVFAFTGVFLWIVYCVPAVACGAAAWFLNQRVLVEYEYLLLDHEISVDAIYGKTRRKKMLNCAVNKIESLAPYEEARAEHVRRQNITLEDYSSGKEEDRHYLMVCKGEQKNVAFVLTPSAEMLDLFGRELSRAVFTR